jgi:L-lysine 2,3-aminomutase
MCYDTKKIALKRYRPLSIKNLDKIQRLKSISRELVRAIRVVSTVFPFRVSNYVVEELIDWDNIPDDPIFQLTFPQQGMLEGDDFARMDALMEKRASKPEILAAARAIQMKLNPHPAGQVELNVPQLNGRPLMGMQHKYKETVLFFPSQGQTCHAYCTYCFRWAQFVGIDNLRFASSNVDALIRYLHRHPEVTDVLFTGGDPLTMSTNLLRRYIEPLVKAKPGNLTTIRIGTKVPAYWPYRFVTDKDADDLLRLFGQVVDKGLHLAIMSHFSHPRELSTDVAQTAIRRILNSGAGVRCQAPLIRHVNDDAKLWAEMWETEVKLGAIPYYMFVERDTGPKHYFKMPLARSYRIFTDAFKKVSGLCRTVRGPSMSATPGKVLVSGVTHVGDEKVFALKFIQARDPEWVDRIFFARYDENAGWLNELKPAFGESEFFFEEALEEMKLRKLLCQDSEDDAFEEDWAYECA